SPLNPDLARPMKWRIFLPPGTARISGRGPPLLQIHATFPPCYGLVIMFDNPSLMHWQQRWGAIRVPVHSRPITVDDVLGAIYAYVSKPLTPSDFAAIVPRDKAKIEEGGRLRQMRGYQHLLTVPQRSDVFQNSVMFGGLRILGASGSTVYMSLDLLP
ncbi:hypothetical protein C8R43DRAFT_851562, partial [Mycena crocata]